MNRIIRIAAPAVVVLGLVAGCDSMPWSKDKKEKSDTAATSMKSKSAVAHIKPAGAASTQPSWQKIGGTVKFTQDGDKVRVQANLTGLPPGTHGIHIHDKGDLSAPDLSSAGPHFNPDGHKHGGPTDENRHAGDLGNLTADDSGKASLDQTLSITGGVNSILGKSVIIHAKADDLKTDPSGNSGGRIAGGVIE